MTSRAMDELIDRALAEDVGEGDVTTEATVAADARARARIVQKAQGVVFGLEVAEAVFRRLDRDVEVQRGVEGEWQAEGSLVLALEGSARALLTGERTALNFLGHLSGIATLTAEVVGRVRDAGGTARVLDTRKTTPGLRDLEKAAVAAGGGTNHRRGLYDAILIKENHIAAAGGIAAAVARAREARPELPLEVEVRSPQEIDEALAAGAPRLLIDNMTPEEIEAAVAQVAGRAEVEVSGGLKPWTAPAYGAIPGVDYLSMGFLTHSAPNLDLSMVFEGT